MEGFKLSYKVKLKPKPAKVFVGVPTAHTKEYALLFVLATLREVKYNPNYLKVVFAITDLGDPESKEYIENVKGLLKHANLMFKTEVIVTKPTLQDISRHGAYAKIIKNIHALHDKFLREKEYPYFWRLDGDVLPLPQTLERLLKLDADIASPLLYQRPMKNLWGKGAYPLVYRHVWNLADLEEHDLNDEQKRLLRKAWIEIGFLGCVAAEKNWRNHKILRNVAFGSGCRLIKRLVLEKIWVTLRQSYLSEDLQFCQDVLAAGFTTAVDLKLHCAHMCMDGKAY